MKPFFSANRRVAWSMVLTWLLVACGGGTDGPVQEKSAAEGRAPTQKVDAAALAKAAGLVIPAYRFYSAITPGASTPAPGSFWAACAVNFIRCAWSE